MNYDETKLSKIESTPLDFESFSLSLKGLDPLRNGIADYHEVKNDFDKYFIITPSVEKRIIKLIQNYSIYKPGERVLNIKEVEKYMHLGIRLKTTDYADVFDKDEDHRVQVYIYMYYTDIYFSGKSTQYYKGNSYKVLPIAIDEQYIILLEFNTDKVKIGRMYTLVSENQYSGVVEDKVYIREVKYDHLISQAEFVKN